MFDHQYQHHFSWMILVRAALHHHQVIERQLQLVLNILFLWSIQHGFTFSSTKTKCIHFCRKYTLHTDPTLCLGDDVLPFVTTVKSIDLIFDRSLTMSQMLFSTK